MDEIFEGDIGMFSVWPLGPPDDDRRDRRHGRLARKMVLELKSAEALSAADAYCRLLNDLTIEMRQQFELFRRLRAGAEALIARGGADEDGGSAGDEAAGKLARADAKAATDAIALIVRTLEKVDSLQRQIARDREAQAELEGDGEAYEESKAKLLALIESQAAQRAVAIADARSRAAGLRPSGGADGTGEACAREPGISPGQGSG